MVLLSLLRTGEKPRKRNSDRSLDSTHTLRSTITHT